MKKLSLGLVFVVGAMVACQTKTTGVKQEDLENQKKMTAESDKKAQEAEARARDAEKMLENERMLPEAKIDFNETKVTQNKHEDKDWTFDPMTQLVQFSKRENDERWIIDSEKAPAHGSGYVKVLKAAIKDIDASCKQHINQKMFEGSWFQGHKFEFNMARILSCATGIEKHPDKTRMTADAHKMFDFVLNKGHGKHTLIVDTDRNVKKEEAKEEKVEKKAKKEDKKGKKEDKKGK